MLSILAAAVLLQLSAASAAVPDRSEAVPNSISQAQWVRRPTGEDMARVYPKRAGDENLEGAAVLECRVTAGGGLADCKATAEQPDGEGFGDAVLALAPIFRMGPQPVTEGPVKIPIQFILPGGRAKAGAIKIAHPSLNGHVEVDCRISTTARFENCFVIPPRRGELSDLGLLVVGKMNAPTSLRAGMRVLLPIDFVPQAAKAP